MSAAAQTAGTATRMEQCSVHGIQFPQVWFPPCGEQHGLWVGTCGECDEDGRLKREADSRLNEQDIYSATLAAMEEYQSQIEKKARERLKAEIKLARKKLTAMLPQFEAQIRAEVFSWLKDQIRSEMRDKIVAELRSAGK